MDLQQNPGRAQSADRRQRPDRDSGGRPAGEVRARQGLRRAVRRPLSAYRDDLSGQLRLHPADPVGRRRPLGRPGSFGLAGGVGRRGALPPGRRLDHDRPGRPGRKDHRGADRRSVPLLQGGSELFELPTSCSSRSRTSSSTTRPRPKKWTRSATGSMPRRRAADLRHRARRASTASAKPYRPGLWRNGRRRGGLPKTRIYCFSVDSACYACANAVKSGIRLIRKGASKQWQWLELAPRRPPSQRSTR